MITKNIKAKNLESLKSQLFAIKTEIANNTEYMTKKEYDEFLKAVTYIEIMTDLDIDIIAI